MDEMWLAGANSQCWSISPYIFQGGTARVAIYDTWRMPSEYIDIPLGVCPALSLKPGQNFEYGNGTVTNPYRFVATVPSN